MGLEGESSLVELAVGTVEFLGLGVVGDGLVVDLDLDALAFDRLP